MKPNSLLNLTPGPIRTRLLRDLILLVAFTVGLLAMINVLLIDEIKHDLADNRIDAATSMVRDEVRSLLLPVQQQLLIIRDGLQSAHLEPTDEQALNLRLIPTLAHIQQIDGAIDATEDGREYFLRRDNDGWVTRLRTPGDPARFRSTRWDSAMQPLERQELTLDYDPRTRPWFIEATTYPDKLVWSEPYIFASLGVPGITASIAWQDDGKTRVTGLDVTLQTILDAIDRLDLGTDGQGFLFSGAGGVFVPPDAKDAPASDPRANAFFSAQHQLGGPLQFDAVAAWKINGEVSGDLIRFHSGGQDWWGGFRPLTDDPDAVWIAVTLPVSETISILQSRWHIILVTTLGILGASLALAFVVVRKYSHQLKDLPKLSINRQDPEQDLRYLIGSGEGPHLEFKSTMRMNLHAKTPGKEIELAWLKGVAAFLNTEGGILLLGIADDGTTLGLGADKFENEDKCQLHFKNLLNQHLGPEYARLVRFFLLDLDELRVGAIECERSDAPVILRDDKKRELFIIRNGPSNIELPISRALKYIRSRF
ncbi:ATP-binding protein [Thiorhodococcus mannitoliphagus]|uniref:ATP-binding protein n=1 Tax=Thiorhodococcus mannitoliphagus TaxID=329406 RepID=A0A6P1DXX6_9GAMM|nr:RNA-binding domain-containing protein [Thiorhodococcus mannitoliphagus]NEX21576.1 ATP-binding protein [Thiorhodococcus mannitoliphagus]